MSLSVNYRIRHEWVSRGYDGKTCWVQCRAGAIPPGAAGGNSLPLVVMTMQKLLLSGSDVFYELNERRTDDLGATWSGPTPHAATLGRRTDPDGSESVICDATPRWHAATGKLLSTGHEAQYRKNVLAPGDLRRLPAYTVYDPAARTWSPWQSMAMPELNGRFANSGAGCSQRFDLENGDILLPLYYWEPRVGADARREACGRAVACVCRCRFDGTTLRYVEHGTEMTCPEVRGFGEPSLTRSQGRFFLTLRNDMRGYVTAGEDGLHFAPPVPWTFDDGAELGSYNTQQHWVTHGDALFLVYTRRGLNNDHVFRHRAPLLMAQVDPERLCVLRATERVLVPERGARLGNFAVTEVSERETWITVSEWMQNGGPNVRVMLEKLGRVTPGDAAPTRPDQAYGPECECFGSDNTVWVARLLWEKPNTHAFWMGGKP
jgi:hypothetical protein